jgi:N-acyl-phosphatidylethanolamine-hydrolysing phospholipase D
MAGLKNYTLEGLLQPQKVDLKKLQGLSEQSTNSPHVTWIGHATCYFELEGVKFITDPVFSQRASYTQMVGPRRFFEPGIEVKDLDIDVVLLSHTHYDHLDYNSAKEIGNKALWLVPLGVKEYLKENLGITNCIEMNWWDSHNIQSNISANPSLAQAEGITITFTPAKHWTARSIFDRNTCLWGSFAVKSSKGSIFFGGDTAYCDVFVQIAKKLGPFDLSLIPVGAYKPRYFMRDHHCDPTEAVQIHKDLQSKRSLAIHWGTFPLADEDVLEPAFELARARKLADVSPSEFFTLRQGETLVLDEMVNFSAAELEGEGQGAGAGAGAGAGLDSLDQQQEFTTPPGDIEILHPQLLEQYVQLVDEKVAFKRARATAKGEKGKRIKAVLDRLATSSTSTSNGEKNDGGIPN